MGKKSKNSKELKSMVTSFLGKQCAVNSLVFLHAAYTSLKVSINFVVKFPFLNSSFFISCR